MNSSRDSDEGAGWYSKAPGNWKLDVPAGARPNSWLRPKTLWQSRNDIIAKWIDPVDAARKRWVELAKPGSGDFVVDRGTDTEFSMLVVGDTGEGDDSQYAVVPALRAQQAVDFAVICSDVIYPTGDLGDYRDKFYHPYRELEWPFYAIPGNHDWYDGLRGFMRVFCGLSDDGQKLDFGKGVRAWFARKLWRVNGKVTAEQLEEAQRLRSKPRQQGTQPAPYFVIDKGPVRFVCIDTGISGLIDDEQRAWLERVSLENDRPKILLTGKPIYVNGRYRPGGVDDIVRHPRANYVLAIGGDTHNYQRYPVEVGDRVIQYVVSGGGGAYLHATHWIPEVNVDGVTEEEFKCYPLRRDSLARFSEIIDRKLLFGLGLAVVKPGQAAAYFERHRGINAQAGRKSDAKLRHSQRLKARALARIRFGHLFHRYGSELFDFNEPPMFKHFLRLDVRADGLTMTCVGVTGSADTEGTPSMEDKTEVPFPPR
ncbi:metallophosphoesterase [Amycolatopsis sp. cg5]|uniref:metallophosphoesterase family protein n=1 Tax=Amycolatopsis sp. cg5 TaxID=3238802 RepID=UPI0035264BA2